PGAAPATRGPAAGTPRPVPWTDDEEATRYERGRPEYPPALTGVLVERLSLQGGARVVDVAAGTGKLTRVLTLSPASVTAVEPRPGMRAQLHHHVPSAAVLAGIAEALPIRTGAADAVTVGQAFHWFQVDDASHELRRVLRPGGRLAIISNQRHEPERWVKRLWSVLSDYEKIAPDSGLNRSWRAALTRTGDFGSFSRSEIANQQRFRNLADFDARFTSISFVMLLDEDTRASLIRDLRTVVADVDPIVLPLRTVVEVAVRAG
ncbi:MAG: class I SAM-dependent methyltransferase, partial [Acidimicrobiales bacterium]